MIYGAEAMSKKDISLTLAFKMPPEKAVKYLEQKGYKVTQNWYDIWENAHAKAFTVAKMTQIDMLKDTKEMLETSLKEGWSYNKFKKQAQEYYIKKGWWGKQEIIDENGEKKTVQLGSKHRIRTIYKQNINSAYNAGRQLEQLEDADIAPYWQYKCILDESTRPEHKAMHNKVFRYNDPVWQHIYPPNGWGCRCFVTNLSEGEVKSKGLKVENSKGALSFENVPIGKNTDEVRPVAKYTFDYAGKKTSFMPDVGWSSNTGACAWGIDVQAYTKLQGVDQKLKDRFISDMAQNIFSRKSYENMVTSVIKSGFKAKGIEQTLSWLKPATIEKLKAANELPETPVIVMQDNRIAHIIADPKTAKQKISQEQLKKLYEIINSPDEVYIDYSKKNSTGLVYTRNIDDKKCLKVCIKLNKIKSGINVNYVSTASIVDRTSLNDSKMYKKIE